MQRLAQDIRYSFRLMKRRPLVTLTIIFTLALGIGANAAVFRVLNSTYLRPLPFADEDRLVRIYITPEKGGAHISPRTSVFVDVRDHATSFESVAAQRFMDMTLRGKEGPQRVTGIGVSSGWAGTLGLEPHLGRVFSQQEEQEGISAPVAIVSHPTWQSQFGGDPDIVGSVVNLEGISRTIIGVMEPGLKYPYRADFWVPMAPSDDQAMTWGLNINARLAPGVTLPMAADELARLSETLDSVQAFEGMTLLALPLREVLIEDEGRLLFFLLAAVGFLLLLVSINIAHVLLAQSVTRQREFAVRTALGANLKRHVSQLITEGVMLSLLGGVCGLIAARFGSSLLSVLVPSDFDYFQQELPYDMRVVIFGILLALVTGLAFGLVPALRASRTDPVESLGHGGRSTMERGTIRAGRFMVVTQIAVALILLSSATAAIQNIRRLEGLDLGYESEKLLTLNVSLAGNEYQDGPAKVAFLERSRAQMESIAGVEGVATVNYFPAEGQGTLLADLETPGREDGANEPILAHHRAVSGDFFGTMGMRILQGRSFTEADRFTEERVVVVSESLAATLWPNEDPIGRRVRDRRTEDEWLRVAGVVNDLVEFAGDHNPSAWYIPVDYVAEGRGSGQAVYVVRTSVEPASLTSSLRQAIWSVDQGMAVFDVETTESLYQEAISGNESATTLSTIFAVIGLVVACVGVYGSMAFSVSQRNRELAIRMAVGGERSRILTTIVARSAVLIVAGVLAGIGGAFLFDRWISSIILDFSIGVNHTAIAAIAIGATALLASYIPARRAVNMDPGRVLRAD